MILSRLRCFYKQTTETVQHLDDLLRFVQLVFTVITHLIARFLLKFRDLCGIIYFKCKYVRTTKGALF